MNEYCNYLVSKHFTTKKERHFYQLWVQNLFDFLDKNPGSGLKNEEINRYINHLTKNKQEWQIRQAQEAIRIYLYYAGHKNAPEVSPDGNIKAQWKQVGSQMINMLRLKQRSLSTERTYMGWLRDFYRFLKGNSPYLIDTSHVKNYLTYLAVDRHVAPSTQNQALNALLFFFDMSWRRTLAIFKMLCGPKSVAGFRLYSHNKKLKNCLAI